jgi:hypothetical protein
MPVKRKNYTRYIKGFNIPLQVVKNLYFTKMGCGLRGNAKCNQNF